MAAAELPVQELLPPNASTAIAASGAPEETGSAGLIAGEGASLAYGSRPDGSKKGMGWLGEIQLANGGIATEYTVQSDAVQQGGRRIDFPTLVPTLSAEEIVILKDDIIPNGKAVPEPIMQKAIKHANEQISKNRSVFAEETNKTEKPEMLPSPVAQSEAGREYSTEELDVLDRAQKEKEFSSDELDQKLVATVFDDPTYIPTRDEFFQAKETKARLKAEGKMPGLLENAATGAGQFLQTIGSMGSEILDDPGDFLARSPATLKATAKKSWRNTNDVTRWIRQANAPLPIGRDEQSGEFIYETTGRSDAESLAGQQMLAAEQGRTIRQVTAEDLKDEEFDRFVMERSRQKELEEWVANTTAPTEFVTSLVTGRNQVEQPMQATSDIVGGFVEATNVAIMGIPFGAGAKTLGASRFAKEVGAGSARILERAAARGIEGMEAGAAKFQEIIQKGTRLTPENQIQIAKWSAAGGIGGGVFGLDTDVPVLSQAQDAARFIGGAYVGYKLGLGTLRNVQKVAGPTSTILRVAANPAEGFDHIAQASVATKLNAFPELSSVREVLENPTRFRPIESTPARLAADPRLGPQTRAVADALSNPLIVQSVRGASAVAGGAIKGAAANTPFVALALNADEEKAAANMLGLGAGFGGFGGAVNRVTGLQQRRAEARASDTARMFMDVELAGGDVAKLAQTYSPQQLGDLASMQGFFRDKVQFVPLNKADFDTNTQALGGAGAAGLFVQAPPGEKARVFLNLDAQRDGIVPHELGHALLKSGALGNAQADTIRAFTTKRYTQTGVESRAREYATAIIQNENAAKFPGQNLPISDASIRAKMDELGQSGMLRGDIDPLDWARDEIFAEDFRQASQSMDFAAIRRNLPADGSWLGSMENLLGAQANALSISGVRIDPATGQPDPLFKVNPILATDPVLKKQLGQYLNNYRDWINHPDQTKARGVRVAPMARASDLINNPQVTFHDYGGGVMANEFARIDPATGQAVFRDQRDINAETAKRQQQVKSLVGSKLMPATDPNLGPKKTADGRVTVRGRILPQQFDFLNGFAQHQRAFARQFETAAANGESMMTRYHAIGSGDTGAFRIKNLGNLEAITREVIPWGWELSAKGNLLASVLDLTQFRNRAIKAINAGDPTIGRLYNNDLRAIETDLKQWMENHRQDLPGSNKIGEQRRDAINSLIGIATNINKAANPFSGKIAGPSSAIKQFRLDRLDTTTPTGRTGFHFDYDKANGNLLPEIATPLPDLSRDLPGQAMPDVVHSTGYTLPKKVPQRGYFSIGTLPTADGRVLEYHVDPTTTIQPRVAGINSIRGEQVAMLEADRHNTRGDNMGGPLHPFLISNQTVARLPDGRGYKAVWANMNSAFVTRAKNIVKTTTTGHALIQIMKEHAHRSNRKFVMDVTAEIDKRSSSMSKDQVDFLHVVLELGAINPKGRMNQAAGKLERTAKAALNKEVPMQELADAQKEYDATLNKYQPMVEFLSRLSPMKSHATRGRMPEFDNEFASILLNYRSQPWFESMASKYRNTKFVDEAARFSFKQRGAAMDRITGIPFAPNVKSMLKSSMDFVNGQNLDIVGVVQLSKDADAFAVYFGKNLKEEAKMSPNESLLRDQLLASGSFKPHPSYDWVMLGPENADSFILDTPADPLKLFPDYAKSHPNKNVRKGSKETVVGTMKKSKIPLVLKR